MRPPAPIGWLRGPAAPQLPVDQSRRRAHPRGVAAPVVPVGLRQGLVAPRPPDGVLHRDAAAGEGAASCRPRHMIRALPII